MRNFRKLRVWHLAHDLATRIGDSLPEQSCRRVPGLRSQIVRAANSIGANLAEGCGRATQREFLNYINIALGSLTELEGHLIRARDSQVMADTTYTAFAEELAVLSKMLLALRRAVEQNVAIEENKKRDEQ